MIMIKAVVDYFYIFKLLQRMKETILQNIHSTIINITICI